MAQRNAAASRASSVGGAVDGEVSLVRGGPFYRGAAGRPADRIQSLESGQTDCSCRRGHLGSIGADYSSVQLTRYSQSS